MAEPLTEPTPGYDQFRAALDKLNGLSHRLLTDLRGIKPESAAQLTRLFCDAIDWWDWTDEGRAAYYQEVDEFVARFPPKGE
jgi:hypothetical protein